MYYAQSPKTADRGNGTCKYALTIDNERKIYCTIAAGNFYEFDDCVGGNYGDFEDWLRYIVLVKNYIPDWAYIKEVNSILE